MAHDDRGKEVLLDDFQEWSKSNWLTHPVFKSLFHQPNPVAIEALLTDGSTPEADVPWVMRAMFARVDTPGMRTSIRRMVKQGKLPRDKMTLWPTEKLRSRFLRDEIARPRDHEDILPILADCMPWLWQEDAANIGTGEAHPVAKLIRFDREDVLASVLRSLPPGQWLDWRHPAADRMMSLVLRKASVGTVALLIRQDPRFLGWRQRKTSGTLLHKACAKLRPELVSLLLGEGLSPNERTSDGLTPAHVALSSALEKTKPRQKASLKTHEVMERLQEVLHLLGAAGGLKGEADALMEELSSDRLSRLRGVVERALLSSSAATACGQGMPRRL